MSLSEILNNGTAHPWANLNVNSVTSASSTVSGNLTVTGNATVDGNLTVNNSVNLTKGGTLFPSIFTTGGSSNGEYTSFFNQGMDGLSVSYNVLNDGSVPVPGSVATILNVATNGVNVYTSTVNGTAPTTSNKTLGVTTAGVVASGYVEGTLGLRTPLTSGTSTSGSVTLNSPIGGICTFYSGGTTIPAGSGQQYSISNSSLSGSNIIIGGVTSLVGVFTASDPCPKLLSYTQSGTNILFNLINDTSSTTASFVPTFWYLILG